LYLRFVVISISFSYHSISFLFSFFSFYLPLYKGCIRDHTYNFIFQLFYPPKILDFR
jgi:hypothetical protein